MVENQMNLCRYPYPDSAIFQPSKMKLVLVSSLSCWGSTRVMTIVNDGVLVIKTVKVLNLSPTHFVYNIRH